jgi:adenylate cyclase
MGKSPPTSRFSSGLAVALIAFGLIAGIARFGGFQTADLLLHDALLGSLSPSSAPPRISLVTISERDIDQVLKGWPIDDDRLAEVLTRIVAMRPRGIGVDIYRDKPVPPSSGRLPRVIAEHPEIIVARKFPDETSSGVPPPSYASAGQVGCNDIVVDPDGNVRRALLYLGDEDPPCYAFALRLSLLYLAKVGIGEMPSEPGSSLLRLGRSTLTPFESNDGGYVAADAGGYQVLLDFRDPLRNAPRYDLGRLLNGPIDVADFSDRLVLIGVDAESVKDRFQVVRANAQGADGAMPGVALHGVIVSQLLRAALDGETPIAVVPDSLEYLWLAFWCALGAALTGHARRVGLLVAVTVGGIVTNLGVDYALMANSFWLPIVPSLGGWVAAISTNTALVARREHQQRALLKRLFALHVDSRIAEEIWAHREALCRGGHIAPKKLVATIFFSDLQGFTRVAESLEPEVFIAWLNEYLDAMTAIIQRHGGVVIRFIGDAILAGFGVPVARLSNDEIARDALNACRCALEIRRVLVELNQNWIQRGLPTATMRIGINTGTILAGSLGNKDRLEYTVHGDVVNTAARLEQMDKCDFQPDPLESPCRTLIGGATQAYVAALMIHRCVGSIVMSGKSSAVEVYELLKSVD